RRSRSPASATCSAGTPAWKSCRPGGRRRHQATAEKLGERRNDQRRATQSRIGTRRHPSMTRVAERRHAFRHSVIRRYGRAFSSVLRAEPEVMAMKISLAGSALALGLVSCSGSAEDRATTSGALEAREPVTSRCLTAFLSFDRALLEDFRKT